MGWSLLVVIYFNGTFRLGLSGVFMGFCKVLGVWGSEILGLDTYVKVSLVFIGL